jgi:hypothetical protein
MDLQVDMWTNTDSVEREQYVCVIMTTVTDPEDATGDSIGRTAVLAQRHSGLQRVSKL